MAKDEYKVRVYETPGLRVELPARAVRLGADLEKDPCLICKHDDLFNDSKLREACGSYLVSRCSNSRQSRLDHLVLVLALHILEQDKAKGVVPQEVYAVMRASIEAFL